MSKSPVIPQGTPSDPDVIIVHTFSSKNVTEGSPDQNAGKWSEHRLNEPKGDASPGTKLTKKKKKKKKKTTSQTPKKTTAEEEEAPLATSWQKYVPNPDPEIQKYQDDYFERVFPHTPLPDVIVRAIVEFLEPDKKPSFRLPKAPQRLRRWNAELGEGCILFLIVCPLLLFSLGMIALFAWSIYIGVHTAGELCGGKNLSMWIEVYGIVGTAHIALSFCEKLVREGKGSYTSNCFGTFSAAWYIVGSVWVYPLDYTYPGCTASLFYTVYWVVTGSWILIAFVCLMLCCALVCSMVR